MHGPGFADESFPAFEWPVTIASTQSDPGVIHSQAAGV